MGLSGEPMSDGDLSTLFDAARWALGALVERGGRILRRAAALVVVLSKRAASIRGSDAVRESYSHSFDAGAA